MNKERYMSDLERRYTKGQVELRSRNEAALTIGGYAAVYDKPSHNLGGFIEVVRSTAFNRVRGQGWPGVMARYNHDDNLLLGTTDAGTLRLMSDDVGLDYEVDLPPSMKHVHELVQRTDVRNSSFAFVLIEDDWGTSEQGYPQRNLMSVGLRDVAPVNSPAYPDATAGLRSLANKFDADFEEVRCLAKEDNLRKFFASTGPEKQRAQPKTLGAAARMAILGREDPTE
jgi:HK97 family phage prohead protease